MKDLTLQGEDEIKLIAIMLEQTLYTSEDFTRVWSDRGSDGQQFRSLSWSPILILANQICLRDTRAFVLEFLTELSVISSSRYQIKTGVYEKGYLFEKALLQIASQSN